MYDSFSLRLLNHAEQKPSWSVKCYATNKREATECGIMVQTHFRVLIAWDFKLKSDVAYKFTNVKYPTTASNNFYSQECY